MDDLGTETAFLVLARAKELEAEGREIIHLEIGEPDFDTPDNIKEAAVRALKEGYTHYGPSAGLPQAREAFAEYVAKNRGVDTSPDQIVITPGAKPIMFFTMLALVDPGDEVIYPNPGFPIYESMINYVGGKPVPIPLEEEKGFSFDLDKFKSLVTEKTKLCIINSPQNPTGGVLSREILEGIAEAAMENGFYVLSDEVYSKIIYEEKHESIYTIPGMPERTIMIEGHSKTYAMTGWRLGFGVIPENIAPDIAKLQTNSNSCTCSFTQMAGIEAVRGPQHATKAMVEEFRVRRDLIVEGLNKIPGFRCHLPLGSFYVFPNIQGTKRGSKELETMLMEEAGVAVLSGTSFGAFGEGYIRLSYANSQDNIRRALEKIAKVLG
ncbi:MAG: aminotransferase class I/II-fold pyridoxal phosphate-dependent enzyme [Candidatus Latescibacteria bacterium]|nr:aminotransferase class I/II-fold pyridoxal phosphate-dependent enzyme [Candidatus Latescibacterota bacterium]NIM21642.1 aminotransferase class I/II-fold pyridoxal phosphate-dependent enzyme [Candidatus Latescibacterota bacterium]NIM64621.1 aminotransferase class I/II-fold pyridoxal phosphate-dependent enzyme [Candidatus Latescibacterota bacterium]NIO01136.1 aminotransferase class I/II-fold pyridoxal phosphate-dependent enzyme [Candidatus Latescibacterota bacterium]NIO27529.1 aminotransferase